MKKYEIKVYNLDWTFKAQLKEDKILNEISFSSNINGWVWQLTIETDYKLEESPFTLWNYVKVIMFDEYHKGWIQIYYWFISQIVKKVQASRELTSFVCLWVWSLLNSVLYTNWSYSKTPSAMITDILNYFRNSYNCITAGTIDSTDWTAQNYNWQNVNCFDIIKSVCEGSWKKFFIDWSGKLNYFKTGSHHFLKLEYEVDSMTITDSLEEVVNEYRLARNGWTVQTYSETASQNAYWKKAKYESNSEINSANTQNQYWNQYITENKNPKEKMTIVLNSKYPFENIKPWDTITILNAPIEISDKTINKITYKSDECRLEIDKEDTLWSVIE